MKYCKKCQTQTERDIHGNCRPCDRARSAAWRAANPEKTRTYQAANPEKLQAARARYEAANRDQRRHSRSLVGRAVVWRAANPEKVRAAVAKWKEANPEKCRIYRQNRRARKRMDGGKISPDLAARLYKLQRGKCACGCKQSLGNDYHLDHIMPIALGGSNTDDNIQLLRQQCNNQKSAKHPIDFMQSRGFLL